MDGKRLNSIQGYRFILFLSVFLFHAADDVFSFGWGGVQAFLVLSSYFVTKKYAGRDDINCGKELWHRVKRLYPPYILLLTAVSVLYIAKQQIPYDIPIYLLSAQNFFWVIRNMLGWETPWSSILGHTWYLTLDVYLFILWILVIKYTPKGRLRAACYAGIVVAIVWRLQCNLCFEDRTISYTIPIGQLDAYCIGALIGLGETSRGGGNKRLAFLDIGIGLSMIIVCIWFVGYTHGLDFIQSYQFFGNAANYTHSPILVNVYLFVAILSAGLLRFCMQMGNGSLLCKPWMVTLGNWSYELYLFHYPFLWILHRTIPNPWILAIVAFTFTLFSAFLWHKYAAGRVQKLINTL